MVLSILEAETIPLFTHFACCAVVKGGWFFFHGRFYLMFSNLIYVGNLHENSFSIKSFGGKKAEAGLWLEISKGSLAERGMIMRIL